MLLFIYIIREREREKTTFFSYYDFFGMFQYVLFCQCSISVVSLKVPEAYPWVYKVCWTKFYAKTLTVFSWSAFSEFASQCSTRSFHEVTYLCITSPVFARFLRYWQVSVFRNIFACRFPRHACFVSFIKMTKCVYAIRIRIY